MQTLIDLVAEAAARFQEQPALTMRQGLRDQVWSHARLWQSIQTVACRLQELGIGAGDRVLLLAPNSPHYVAGLLGIMLRGGIAVPLDLGSTPEFIDKVARHTRAVALVGNSAAAPPAVPGHSFADLLAAFPQTYAGPLPQEGDIAEIIFTSGTTSHPKGVMLSHANILASIRSATTMVRPDRDWRLLSLLPLSHMFEQTVGLFGPLQHGALIHYGVPRQSAAIGKALRRYRINVMVAVPQLLVHMLQGIERGVRRDGHQRVWESAHCLAPHLPFGLRRRLFGRVHAQLGGRLEAFLCGGAYLPPEVQLAWERLGVRAVQGYGATECAPLIACNTLDSRLPGSVGYPAPGVQVRIAPDGEIQVQGANVFSGYWHDETASASALLDGGWYCTGDLGEFDAAGHLFIRGRKKDRVTLSSGMNVFLEDIEGVLNRQPGVRASVVVDVQKPNGETGFSAVLLLEAGGADRAEAVVRQANAELAMQQRISGIHVWEREDFPRTAIGKLKRHAVRDWLMQSKSSDAAPAMPAQAGIPLLQRLLAELSGIEATAISAQSDLTLDLGLSSLARVELAQLLEENFNVPIEDADLAQVEKVAQLEALIEHGGSAPARYPVPVWPLQPLAGRVRRLLQAWLLFPVHGLFARPFRVEGLEHLDGLEQPALLISNHASHIDTVSIIRALPEPLRHHLAVAAAQDYFFRHRLVGSFISLLMNTFPFSREAAIRSSLEHCGYLADLGWSVLIFPEGTRSTTGELLPFRLGIGLLATQMQVPVVPITVLGGCDVLPKGHAVPRAAPITVRFGAPLRFSGQDNPTETALRLQQVVAGLMANKA